MRRWPFWACLLVMATIYTTTRLVGDLAAVGLSVAGAALLLMLARRDGLTYVDVGLAGWDNTRRGLRWGAVCIAIAALFYAFLLLSPVDQVLHDDRTSASVATVLLDVFVVIPLQTVLWEEVAFRGVLWAIVKRDHGPRIATAVSSSIFGLWHVLPAITFSSASGAVDSTVGSSTWTVDLTIAVTVVFTGLAGVLLCELRRRSGSLLTPMAAHWSANGLGALASFLS